MIKKLYLIKILSFCLVLPTSVLANDIVQKSLPGYLVLREGTSSDPIRYKKNSVYFNWNNGDYAFASDWPEEGMFLIELPDPSQTMIAEKNLFGDETKGFGQDVSDKDTNFDNRIDKSDASWRSLYTWEDKNFDSYIQNDELKALSLSDANVIHLDDEIALLDGKIYSLYAFSPLYDKVNTRYIKDHTLDIDTLFMPTLRGYGGLPDLHIAASQNGALKEAVLHLCMTKLEDVFSTKYMSLRSEVEQIMYLHAGVEEVYPKSRGEYIDARQLMILEKIMNKPFSGYVNKAGDEKSPNPNNRAAKTLQQAWTVLLNRNTAALLAQCSVGQLFFPAISYNVLTDEISLGMKQATPDTVKNIGKYLEGRSDGDRQIFWTMMENFLNSLDSRKIYASRLLEALKNPPPELTQTSQ